MSVMQRSADAAKLTATGHAWATMLIRSSSPKVGSKTDGQALRLVVV